MAGMKFVLKKKKKEKRKKVLKTKTNLHYVHQKTSKGKKKIEKKRNERRCCRLVVPMCLMMRFQAEGKGVVVDDVFFLRWFLILG